MGSSPVACATVDAARWFKSRGRFGLREGGEQDTALGAENTWAVGGVRWALDETHHISLS